MTNSSQLLGESFDQGLASGERVIRALTTAPAERKAEQAESQAREIRARREVNPDYDLEVLRARTLALQDDVVKANQAWANETDPVKREKLLQKSSKVAAELDSANKRLAELEATRAIRQDTAELAAKELEFQKQQQPGEFDIRAIDQGARRIDAETKNLLANANQDRTVELGRLNSQIALESARQNLQALQTRLSGTGFGPQEREQMIKVATDLKIPVAGKSDAQILSDINIKNGEQILSEARKAAQESLGTLAVLEQVEGLKDAPTGFLYGLPVIESIDRLAAQFGSKNAQKREALNALKTRLIPIAKAGQAGQVSNLEFQVFGRSVPGPGLSPETNAILTAGLIAIGNRAQERARFLGKMIGPMTAQDAENAWNEYVEANPAIYEDETGTILPNPHRMTPDMWIDALQNPAAALAKYRPSPDAVATLPIGSQGPDGRFYSSTPSPWIVVDGKVRANANVWAPLFPQAQASGNG